MKWLILLLMFVLASPIVYGQTSLFSTKVNESLKKQLDINGKWNFLLFADGSTQSTAYTGIGGGDVIGPSASIDSEIAIYNSTTGKLLKRFAGTGIVTATSGVIGTATTTGTGAVVLATSPAIQTPTISDGAIFNLLSNNSITIDASTNPRTITTGVVRINHTPGMVGTRPFTLNIDAAGFGDTHAVSTDFTATGIGAGEQNHLFDINVNTANSTGGEVNGLVMAKTGTGAVDCNAVEVYPGVDVIAQRTGVETSIEQAFAYNGAYADITSNLSSAASDVQLFVANGDIVYIGNAGTFNSFAVTLAVAASGAGIKPTFEYSAGASSWTAFSPTDGTNGFRNLGGTIAWGTLAGWATDTVNAVGSKYWVRITRTQNTLTTPPTEDLVKYIASVNYGWDKDGDISAATLNGLTCAPQTNGFTIAGGTTSKTLTVPLDASVSGTNTGDNATNSQYNSLVSNATHTGDVLGGTSTTVVGINGTLMSGLATGIVKNTTTTGVPSIAVAGDFPTLNQNTTGSAATLTTPRSVYGNNFDGSADLAQIVGSGFGGTGNGFTKFTGPITSEKTFTLPNSSETLLYSNGALGTPSSGTLTSCVGLPISSGVSGLASGIATFLTTPSSANLTAALTGETGTGNPVFSDSPVFTTQITTPSIVSAGALGITPASGSNVNIDLATTGDFAVNTSQFYVDTSSGNVGIGTTTPGVKLDVAGGTMRVQNTGLASSGKGLELIYIPGTDNGYIQAYDRDTAAYKVLNLEGSSVLLNSYGGGNVAIGTTTPSAQLHTTGTVRFQNFGAGAANFDAAGNVSSSSDERLKNVAGEFTVGLNQLLGINPIQYRWNALSGLEKDNLYTGFSAQNVRKFVPEAVSVDARGYYNLQDRALIAALVNAVKQLTAEIDELRSTAGLAPKSRIGIDRQTDSASVVKSKVAQIEKECGVDEVTKETKEVVENIDGVDTVKTVEVLKAGIVEKDKKFFRLENVEEATQRYRLTSQEPQEVVK